MRKVHKVPIGVIGNAMTTRCGRRIQWSPVIDFNPLISADWDEVTCVACRSAAESNGGVKPSNIKPYSKQNLTWEEIDRIIGQFTALDGAMQLWKSWRDTMIKQGREVSKERMEWDTLSDDDKILDAQVAFDVITDFMSWYMTHPHE
jgi:hypothetical protein